MSRVSYRKTWKEFGDRKYKERKWLSFSQTWSSERIGRFWKRKLSRARRTYAKLQLRGIRCRYPDGIESTVNWKSW